MTLTAYSVEPRLPPKPKPQLPKMTEAQLGALMAEEARAVRARNRPDYMRLLPNAHNPSLVNPKEQVLHFIQENPGCLNAHISQDLGRSKSWISTLLTRLVREGKVERTYDRGQATYRVAA